MEDVPPALIVVGGLPGTGKSTLADALATRIHAPVFTKDRIEASLWRDGITAESDSWQVAEDLLTTLAGEQLRRGQSAILDTVARMSDSRAAWQSTADQYDATFALLECMCSDLAVHRTRVEGRVRGIPGWYELSWEDVQRSRRRYEPWPEEHLVLDAMRPLDENLDRVLEYLNSPDDRDALTS